MHNELIKQGRKIGGGGSSETSSIEAIVNVYGAKNLNSYPYHETAKTVNGITYTDNGDGTITVSGIATDRSYIVLHSRDSSKNSLILKNGTYLVTGSPSGASENTYYIGCGCTKNSDYFSYGNEYGQGLNVVLDGDDTNQDSVRFHIFILVKSGTNLTTPITFKPMIRDARISDDTWVPYAMTNKELTEEVSELNSKIDRKATILDKTNFSLSTSATTVEVNVPEGMHLRYVSGCIYGDEPRQISIYCSVTAYNKFKVISSSSYTGNIMFLCIY